MKKIIEEILEAAIQAPSGDNVQPWRFEIASDFSKIDLYNLPERDDSYYNYQQAAAYISHGAVIENIAIASRHLGVFAKIHLFPNPKDFGHVARIVFQSAELEFEPLYCAIFDRYTNRFNFKNFRLSEIQYRKIIDSVRQFEDVTCYFVREPDSIKKFAKALIVNDQLVFERPDIHRFLFEKIRWNKKQIDETKDGMPIDTLGLTHLEKIFFPIMRFWWFVKVANYFGLSKIIGLKGWKNLRSATLIGQIAVKKADRYGLVSAGRAMQRIWLEATLQGLAFQPIVGIYLLAYRSKFDALTEFSEKHRQMVSQAEQSLRRMASVDSSEEFVMGFRIGKGRSQAVRTLRKAVIDWGK